jgi:hypothetical protein
MAKSNGPTKRLLSHLGARNVESLDYSGYEDASIIDDLMALWSCMQVVATGGNFVSITPTNNLCHHGFIGLAPK